MGIFGNKNNTIEFIELNNFYEKMNSLLTWDGFISQKSYSAIINNAKIYSDNLLSLEKNGVLIDWCKKNNTNYKETVKLLSFSKSIAILIKAHNDSYIEKHLVEEKNYLDSILKDDDPSIVLDDEQRRVVLADEDYTLVVAGAGAGKTTTIEAKVKYLVERQGVDPKRVLIVSFTKKATEELQERFKKLKIPADIATFHSIGNTIIKEFENTSHQIFSSGFLFNSIKNYLTIKIEDESFIRKLLLFFASYLTMPFDETNTSLLFKTLSEDNITTIKEDLKKALDDYKDEQTRNLKTFKDERVRSIDECRIANYLYINGIDYVYEPIYKYGFKDTIKPYTPDFYIQQGERKVYLEHFGVTEDGHNNRFNSEQLAKYKKSINDKIQLHKEHGTELIYTFSKYNDGKDLITHLKERLVSASIDFNSRSDIEIYRQLATNAEDKYFHKLIQLLSAFINRFKVSNLDESKFDEWLVDLKDERTKLFINICRMCFKKYKIDLQENKAIDFEDMINNASNILDKKIRENDKIQYDYILVDEYQDISLQRFDLCEKLSKASDAKIIAVGDDWQSIFRFSGAKIDLFTHFKERMGYANVMKITRTYRNSQELIDIAGNFIMSNQKQIPKLLKSSKSINDPVILMTYDDSYEKDENDKGPFFRLGEAIESSLDQIVEANGEEKTVLLIGRYNFEGKNLARLEEFFICENDNIKSKKYPLIHMEFLTAHSSKGLGYDNVIIINGKDDVLGFPSKIEDDPIMKLVIKDDESIEFAEERRLFYVALTRTKNRVFIITPQNRPSKFVVEIKNRFPNVMLKGNNINPLEKCVYRVKCPECGYPLQRRKNNNYTFVKPGASLWICSNDPEECGFITNDLKGGKMSISKCPECEDGYLVVKHIKDRDGSDTGGRMLGCTNYNKDGTGCKVKMFSDNYTQDKEQIAFQSNENSLPLENLIFAGVPITELYDSIVESLKMLRDKNFDISYTEFKNFLLGNSTKSTRCVNGVKGFGVIDQKHKAKMNRLLQTLITHEIIEINSNLYNSIVLNEKKIDETSIRAIFADLVNR